MSITLAEPYRQLAEKQAESAGYANLASYIEHLIERADIKAETCDEAMASLRQGLADAEAGRTRPIREALRDLAKKHDLTIQNGLDDN
jgi:predicted transcriptional regulator